MSCSLPIAIAAFYRNFLILASVKPQPSLKRLYIKKTKLLSTIFAEIINLIKVDAPLSWSLFSTFI